MPVVDSAQLFSANLHRFRRAAVIIPPIRDFYCTPHRCSSLGAQIVARLLSRSGFDVEFLHFPAMHPKGTAQPLPRQLNFLECSMVAGEKGKLAFFTTWRHFGPAMKKCAEMVDAVRPDLCFFSVFAFAYSDDAIELAFEVKRKKPSVPIIAGGGGPSVFPEYFLRHECVDYVVSGEAEVALPLFLREILRQRPAFERIPNFFWKESGKVKKTQIAAITSGRDIEPSIAQSAESSRTVTYSTSLTRGCPKQCGFCSSRYIHGSPFRTASLEAFAHAVQMLPIDESNISKQMIINFEDDNLAADERFLASVIAIIKQHLPRAEFIAENGIDYALLSLRMCEWLIGCGMKKFNLSLASIHPDILEKRNRALRLKQYEQIIDLLSTAGIQSVTYFICGFKEDTLETTTQNLAYLAKKQTVIGISPFYAVPGMPDFGERSRFERIPSSLCLGSVAFPWNNSLSTETMITAFRLSRYINLSKNPHRSEIENQLLAIIANKRELYTIIREGKRDEERIVSVPGQDRELVKLFFKKISVVG